ncbi:MAG TPA: 3-isopropylmalate dehydratase large subunit [Bacteroidetes bacterium]|nr:3-isopropylmalate dehydratase large subunit [Bacteroidota bacterium]
MKEPKTLFDKIWDSHVVRRIEQGPDVLYIDLHLVHEVTSPQAFAGLAERGLKVFRPCKTVATADHNVPTVNQEQPMTDPLSRKQVDQLTRNTREHGIRFFGPGHPFQGVVHVMGPELGLTQPGMTVVCGDSHTSTHGAFGTVAFGIGTTEVETVLATQCLLQNRPEKMRINLEGKPGIGVTAKDIALYLLSVLSASGATQHFIEYAGETVLTLTMEERMTLCNMSIEMGARGGLIAPDEVTFEYLKGREFSPSEEDWNDRLTGWKKLFTDPGAKFNREYRFDISALDPMITYGTNPGMGIKLTGRIPTPDTVPGNHLNGFKHALQYMGFEPGQPVLGRKIDYVFVGSCTNGRISDLRAFASLVKGRKKAPGVTAWIVPGSQQVEKQARKEGIDRILKEAGFELRQPGCSACLAMNDDKVPPGKYCLSTSNRNFRGRQGPGSRTLLASPLTAAASAVTGVITDPRELM